MKSTTLDLSQGPFFDCLRIVPRSRINFEYQYSRFGPPAASLPDLRTLRRRYSPVRLVSCRERRIPSAHSLAVYQAIETTQAVPSRSATEWNAAARGRSGLSDLQRRWASAARSQIFRRHRTGSERTSRGFQDRRRRTAAAEPGDRLPEDPDTERACCLRS